MSSVPASSARIPGKVIVVGAGMVGLSTAWFLQEHGVEVTVVDRHGVAAGSSWGNAGWLLPALTTPLPEPAVLRYGIKALLSPSSPVYIPPRADLRLARFLTGFARHSTQRRWLAAMDIFGKVNVDALEAYDVLADGGVGEPTTPAQPFLVGFTDEGTRRHIVDELRQAQASGVDVDFRLLTGDEARTVEPALSASVESAIAIDGQRFINPGRYVHSLAESVRARGGKVEDGVEVTGIRDLGAAGVSLSTATSGELRADAVVVATGTWLNSLVKPFGVRRIVQAGRGYSFSIALDHVPTRPVYFPGARVACTPLGDRLRVAGMMEFRKAEAPLDPRRIEAIVNATRPLFVGADWNDRQDEWVGSRPCTADGLPLVGTSRSPRVHVAGGHGMWGVALGPLTGRHLATTMITGEVPAAIRPFDPLR